MFPRRKRNRLQHYDYSTKGAYFITICTKGKHKLLCEFIERDEEVVTAYSQYGKIVKKYIEKVSGMDCYVIMPNHVHMIINIDGMKTVSVSDIIRSMKIMVTKEIGLAIFQRSFHDHIIRDETDYIRIREYIESNPMKWNEDCFFI